MRKLTIIVPCYNEEESLPLLFPAILEIVPEFEKRGVEISLLFVDDGSTDQTLKIIKEKAKKDESIHYLSFSRNFGKEAAIYAGLTHAKGDYVTLIDADLQDPPQKILEMYDVMEKENYDVVGLRRVTRKGEPVIRSFFARRFYRLINRISKVEMVSGARDCRLMKREVVDAILQMDEYNRYSKGLFSFVGFKTKWLEYENVERVAGQTKWSFWKLFVYAIEGIIAFSTVPLSLAICFGILFLFLSFLLFLIFLIQYFIFHVAFQLWFLITILILFVSGIQLFCIGISSLYLAKTYLETKKRPVYVIREKDETSIL